MKNVEIVETGNLYGNMNTQSRFYPEGLTRGEIADLFLERRMEVGADYGFDGHKMFMADQLDKKGTYFEITDEYVEANPNGWSDIKEDILIVTHKLPGVVIGHPVADCPVVMMEDQRNGVTAIAHCSAELIDKRLPMMIVDALVDSYGTREEDILAYVSACAGNNWTYDSYPKWATDNDLWQQSIILDKKGLYHINMRVAIAKQLSERKLEFPQIEFNWDDTITNLEYYSNSASSPNGLNDESKAGRHFAGAFYPTTAKVLKKTLSRR